MMYLSLLFVIMGAVFYEILEELAPTKENHYLFLMLAYFLSLFLLFIYLIVSKYDFNNMLKDLNYQGFIVGIAAMFADYGLITSYNSGWKVSTLNITYSISTFLILLLIGSIFFNESISSIKIFEIIISVISIFLINHKTTRKKGRR